MLTADGYLMDWGLVGGTSLRSWALGQKGETTECGSYEYSQVHRTFLRPIASSLPLINLHIVFLNDLLSSL